MLVVDDKRSEHGPQRKKAHDGRLFHCCCICGHLGKWGRGWSVYCSERELDEERPVPKFCSDGCRQEGGPKASRVTEEMKRKAKDAEWRGPKIAYREATSREKYAAAVSDQRRSLNRNKG